MFCEFKECQKANMKVVVVADEGIYGKAIIWDYTCTFSLLNNGTHALPFPCLLTQEAHRYITLSSRKCLDILFGTKCYLAIPKVIFGS